MVAAKNEERVIGRLLHSLVELDYPEDKLEIIVVEDGSSDRTAEICLGYAARHPELIKFFHRDISNGKPSALNFGLKRARGDVIAILDADNVPACDLLRKAATYFEEPKVAAIQGMTSTINADENMISKLSSYEEAAWFRLYIMGKEDLNLFVPMTGSCGFVRRRVLEELGGWDEDSIAEDVELAARLVEHGHKIRYAPDVRSWQEYASSMKELSKQRTRWFRGYIETFVKYGSLLRIPSKVTLDAEATLSGPLLLNLCLVSYALAFYNLFFQVFMPPVVLLIAYMTTLLTGITLLMCGVALFYFSKPRRLSSLLWVPAVYAYWTFQTLIAFRALVNVVLRRRRAWVKTEKRGSTTLSSGALR